ncbi:MAG: hypothetical protein GX242_00170, partial [Clostridiales bacterium]|nr:hypothetical protein [Clostridiales bacterium]
MKGRYNKDTRRVFTSSGYKITIAVIIAIAIALMMLLLVFLPVVDDTITEGKTIVSIVSNSDEIGVGVDLSQILCTVYYSDGTHSEVAFTELNIEGLDVTKAGLQNVSLNYGGFEQTITLEVKDVSCQLQYQASVGGRIQGETTQLVPNGSDAATVIAIPETGYFFEGWNDGYPEATRTDRQVNKNATYIATFRKATYTVRFWQPDASIAVEERVAFGEAPAKTPNPEADPRMQVYGHTFSNWIPHDFSSIDRDMDIYPEYIKTATDVEVEIPTDIYGASMGTTDLNEYGYYAYGEAASIISNPYNSRVLAYWEIQTSSGEYERLYPEDRKSIPVGSSSYHTEFISTSVGSNRHKLSFEANENINKVRTRAIFAHEQSEIRFVHNQNLPEIGVRMLRYGDTIGSLINDSDFFAVDKGPGEVIGMKFLGWFTEGTNIPVTEDSIFEQPATVIARWEKRTYTVRFYYEGEDYTYDKSVYVQYGNTLASATSDALGTIICGIPSEIPYKNHYIFVGWQNGITQEIIDDKTKITTHPLYLDNGKPIGDFANRIVTMIPIFAPIKHKLTVAITGAGSVNLHIKEGAASSAPEYTMTELSGVVEIREDFIYTISFEASVGYALKRVIKTDINGSVPYIFENNEDNITININPLGDNDIIVEFEHKKFDINISIDESVGSIEYLGNYLISKDNLIKLQVDYNASINLIIGTINPEFTIENIMVDGQYLMFENGEFMGADLQEYTLNLEQIRRDIEIIVNYKSKKHKVVTPNLQSGSIQLTSIYNPNVTTDIANTENEYVHGTENVYRITAPLGGYYISDIKINGYSYDFYNTGKASLIYHNWYINGVNSQITVVDINGELYYHYGNFEYNGKTYAYCQTAKGALVGVETVVFEIKADSVYDKVIDTAIISAGYNLLNIQSRNIY